MVAEKKMGTKLQRSGVAHAVLDNSHLRQDQRMKDVEIRTISALGNPKLLSGPTREAER